MSVVDILTELVAFPTICESPNIDLIDHVSERLEKLGFRVTKLPGAPKRASLLASIGPITNEGIIFSAHSDVVPVEGQPWSSDPFELVEKVDEQGTRLVARGTSDMKGFLACMLKSAEYATTKSSQLQNPLHLAISYDEEIGCVGIRSLLSQLQNQCFKARGCIIGEPTEMEQITGHKGKLALKVLCTGLSAHSSNPARGCNAILLACDVINEIRLLQSDLANSTTELDNSYEVPYSTAQVGKIKGGIALNIVPDQCEFEFEMRLLATTDAQACVQRIKDESQQLIRDKYPAGTVEITELNGYPGLKTDANCSFIRELGTKFIRSGTTRINFGTEGGLFQEYLDGIPVVVCGPGSIDRAHKADEWIRPAELAESVSFLNSVVDRLCEKKT